MKKINESVSVIQMILSQKKYIFTFLISTIVSFVLFYWLTVTNVADNDIGNYVMMSGFNFTFISIFLTFIIALLFGVFIALVIYRYKLIKSGNKKLGFFGTLGFFFGVFSAGCPSCGSAVFALFGAPLALMFLPYQGLELKALSIVLLVWSNYSLSRKLIKCNIKLN